MVERTGGMVTRTGMEIHGVDRKSVCAPSIKSESK